MKKSLLRSFLVVTALGSQLHAVDLSNRFTVGGLIGAAVPVAPDYVTSYANDVGLDLGGFVSFYVGPRLGVQLSYENINLGEGKRLSPIDLSLLFRPAADRNWSPTFQLGMGSASGVNSDRIENLNLKAAIGLDYFLNDAVSIGPQLNYYFISHSGGNADTYAHLIGLNFFVAYSFGPTS